MPHDRLQVAACYRSATTNIHAWLQVSLALCQLAVGSDKEANWETARAAVKVLLDPHAQQFLCMLNCVPPCRSRRQSPVRFDSTFFRPTIQLPG